MNIRYRLEDIDTKDPDFVCDLVIRLHQEIFPGANSEFIRESFKLVVDMFAGNYEGFQPMDTKYHDLEHTLQATLCFVRLIVNRHHIGTEPKIEDEDFKIGLIAILLHDMGYLKEIGDTDGTGAKYTYIHEIRSSRHARSYLEKLGWLEEKIVKVDHLIRCTGPRSPINQIPFANEKERMLGQAVCTADFIGQMSDPQYVEKLPSLFQEFSESYEFQELAMEKRPYQTFFELLQKTPGFWNDFVKGRMSNECNNLWQFLKDPATGDDPYIDHIEKNIQIIEKQIKELESEGQ